LAGPLGEDAATAGRTGTRIGTRYRRLAERRGKPKAQVVTGNTLLRIAYALLAWV
jgi:transposase